MPGKTYGAVSTEEEEDPNHESFKSATGDIMERGDSEDVEFDFEPLSVRLMDVVRVYWHLGLIAFGGPSAHGEYSPKQKLLSFLYVEGHF